VSELKNIEGAVALAANYVFATWQQAYMGTIPGLPVIKANINRRREAADSIIIGRQLNLPNSGRFEGHVLATKQVAIDFEDGKAPWDMKPMLLGGPKARSSKGGGRYNIIPFRHRTPGGASVNQHFSGVMPASILKKAMRLKPGQRLRGTEKTYPARANKVTGSPHRSGIYEGMKKVEKKYGEKTQSKYMTFRVVSDSSPSGAWWHPGNPAYKVAAHVADYCRPGVEKMVRDAAIMDIIDLDQVSVGMHIGVR
jgi:hypothetical protein